VRSAGELATARTRDGSEIRWLTGAPAIDAERQSVAETVIERGGAIKEHYHRLGEEVYVILEGSGDLILNGVTHPVEGGDSALVPPLTRHKLLNTGTCPLRFITTCVPAFEESDLYIVE
jgi:mannose-6-phosphate isomerase-like protein (cupin superfamily)